MISTLRVPLVGLCTPKQSWVTLCWSVLLDCCGANGAIYEALALHTARDTTCSTLPCRMSLGHQACDQQFVSMPSRCIPCGSTVGLCGAQCHFVSGSCNDSNNSMWWDTIMRPTCTLRSSSTLMPVMPKQTCMLDNAGVCAERSVAASRPSFGCSHASLSSGSLQCSM